MSAIKFIKLYGLNSARVTVEDAQENTHYCTEAGYQSTKLDVAYEPCPDCVSIPDLKRLVESVDLIGKYHSIDHAKNHYNNMREALNQYQYENKDIEDLSNELKQAIADYEAIHSLDIEKREFELGLAPDSDYVKINDMGDDSHIENHISPNCKVGVK